MADARINGSAQVGASHPVTSRRFQSTPSYNLNDCICKLWARRFSFSSSSLTLTSRSLVIFVQYFLCIRLCSPHSLVHCCCILDAFDGLHCIAPDLIYPRQFPIRFFPALAISSSIDARCRSKRGAVKHVHHIAHPSEKPTYVQTCDDKSNSLARLQSGCTALSSGNASRKKVSASGFFLWYRYSLGPE